MPSKRIEARNVPQAAGFNVVDQGVHEYGYRVLARLVNSSEEYWRIMPNGVVALYVWYSRGHLVAHYQNKAGKITA